MQMAYYPRSKFNFAQNNHINSTASGENTFHHYLCIGLPQIRSAKSDFIFAISMSKTGPLPPTQILHDHCLQFLLGITIVPIREIEDNKTMVMHFFLVGGAGVETRCIVVYVKMVNCRVFVFPFILQRPRCHYAC